jgi:hypothetical protein
MIVCDRCKKIPSKGKNEPFLYELTGSKMEETKTGKGRPAAGREIVKIPMHLCDGCITAFNRGLGAFIVSVRDNEPAEFENDLSQPVGITERDFGTNDPTLMANEGFVSHTK